MGGRAWVAAIAAVVSVMCSIAVPFLPVTMKTAELNWPQGTDIGSVSAPLTAYVPVDLSATVPCTPTRPDTTLVSTTPPKPSSTTGLSVTRQSSTVDVVVRGETVLSAPAATCSSIEIAISATQLDIRAIAHGGAPSKHATRSGDHRPQIIGVYSDLSGPRSSTPGLTFHATVDTRYDTSASVVRAVVIALAVITLAVALVALAMLDGPQRRWRTLRRRGLSTLLTARDWVVLVVLVGWHVIGANSADNAYLFTMARVAQRSDYLANYYRWFGAPETPFGWYYRIFGLMSDVSVASIWIRLPALLCGIAAWIVISRLILPRVGRTMTTGAPAWSAALVFVLFVMAFNNGLRPEPVICLGLVLVIWLVERTIATRRLLPLAIACMIAAFTAAAGPTGLIAIAPILVGAPGLLRAGQARWHAATEDRVGGGVAGIALLAPIVAAGFIVMPIVFANLSAAAFIDSTAMKSGVGPSEAWYNEYQRYATLFEMSADGSIIRRMPVLLFAMAAIVAALGFRGVRGLSKSAAGRMLGITAVSLVLLALTPTKFTHHFGAFAGLAAILTAVASAGVAARSTQRRRNIALTWGAVLAVAAVAFAGRNAFHYPSNLDLPFALSGVTFGDGPAATTLLSIAVVVALVVALYFHTAGPSNEPGIGRSWPTAAIAVGAAAVIVFEFGSMASVLVTQRDSYSVPAANLAAFAGRQCGLADDVLVETDPTSGILPTLDASLEQTMLSAPAGESPAPPAGAPPLGGPPPMDGPPPRQAPSKQQAASKQTSGFRLNGVSPTVDAPPSTPGQTPTPAPSGPAMAPFGLAPSVPIVGSYNSGNSPVQLTTGWFRLPPATPDRSILAVAVAGIVTVDSVRVEYSTDDHASAGTRRFRSIPRTPGWLNLRMERSAIPADATAIRLVATDPKGTGDSYLALTPPRLSRLVTLQEMVGRTDPTLIDWTTGFAFPCQRPFDLRTGVAELPRWRLLPDNGQTPVSNAWQDAAGGGPLGWLSIAADRVVVPGYLRNNVDADWGQLERLVPRGDVTPAEGTVGRQTHSGTWAPAPLRFDRGTWKAPTLPR